MMISFIHHFFLWIRLDTSSLPLLEKLMQPTAVSRGDQWASYNRKTHEADGWIFPHYLGGQNQSLKSAQNNQIAVLRYAWADNTRSPTVHILFLNTPVFILPRFFKFSHTNFLHSHASFLSLFKCTILLLFPKSHAAQVMVGSKHSGVVDISHMLFAYDTLVFCGAKSDHLRFLHA
jgi:hypothetical protein